MAFSGAMSTLQNLIPDPTTSGLWQPRPAAVKVVDLSQTIAGATFISCWINIGTRVYGMVNSSANPGKDQPFCYDVMTQLFIPITGFTAANTPFSPAPSGNWTPPHMALIGGQIIIAHPGFTVGNGYFGVIDITFPFALTYVSTNTSPVPLIFPPTWVAQFNGRCYFLVNPPNSQPAAYFSDSLIATQISLAQQILTFGDNQPLTCAAGLALQNQLGGVVASLMVFKSVSNIYQITGDSAFNDLAINSLNVATGTFAPNSITSSEKGLMFMAPDGIRLIDFNGSVNDPIGKDGQGVTVPFIQSLIPSRSCAGFNVGIYRVQVENGAAAGSPQQEYWYDAVRQVWSGPHTTSLSLIIPYQNTFLCTIQGAGAIIFQSDPQQSSSSTYVENGGTLLWTYQTVDLPDTEDMCENCCIEATINIQVPPHVGGPHDIGTVRAAFLDQNGIALDTVSLVSTISGTLWGHFNWGQANWGGRTDNLYPQQLAWHKPIVFRRGSLQITGVSASGAKIGQTRLRIQQLGYLQQFGNYPAQVDLFTLDVSELGGPDVLG